MSGYQGAEQADPKGTGSFLGREKCSLLDCGGNYMPDVLPKLRPNTEKDEFHYVNFNSVHRTPKTRAVQIPVKNQSRQKQDSTNITIGLIQPLQQASAFKSHRLTLSLH